MKAEFKRTKTADGLPMTFGKLYDVLDVKTGKKPWELKEIKIRNDLGEIRWYKANKFKLQGEMETMRNYRTDDESGNQEALFQWAQYNTGRLPELEFLHHVPNGGKRDAATATVLKRQGVKAGVPDIVLPAARGGYHGLYIELKAGKNTVTAKQKSWLNFLWKQGYFTAVCYGWQIAAELIEKYLLHTTDLGEAGQIWGRK